MTATARLLRRPARVLAALLAVAALAPGLAPAATVAERLLQYGPAARARLREHFASVGVVYPPRKVVLVGLKAEQRLDVYASAAGASPRFVRSYPILAASGVAGPKLRQGDFQVPEGLYRVVLLNPNSSYHLSLRLDYPSTFDRRMARADRRTRLGGDIMIHGRAASIGCLAMGDPAAEDLFVLAADTGIQNVSVVLAPTDLRVRPAPRDGPLPSWIDQLYARIRAALDELPAPPA